MDDMCDCSNTLVGSCLRCSLGIPYTVDCGAGNSFYRLDCFDVEEPVKEKVAFWAIFVSVCSGLVVIASDPLAIKVFIGSLIFSWLVIAFVKKVFWDKK